MMDRNLKEDEAYWPCSAKSTIFKSILFDFKFVPGYSGSNTSFHKTPIY